MKNYFNYTILTLLLLSSATIQAMNAHVPLNQGIKSSECDLSVSFSGCPATYWGYPPLQSVTLTPNVTGGVAPYSYQWGQGQTTSSITVSPEPISNGITLNGYQVTVTDANGCVADAYVLVQTIDVSCGNGKVRVCHKQNIQCVGVNGATALLAQGGKLGDCYFNPCGIPAIAAPQGGTNIGKASKGIQIFPNPATDKINVSINADLDVQWSVRVLNSIGQTVFSRSGQNNRTVEIDARGFDSGLYLVEYQSDGERKVEKIMVQH